MNHGSIGQKEVYDFLDRLGISYHYLEHPAAYTIEIGRQYWKDLPGTHCKNLFFRNHKGNQHYLVIFQCEQQLDIHDLEKRLKQGKLSFASEKRMDNYLGLKPGSVSPFGLINDQEHHVYVFLDEKLKQYEYISFHPNDNRASLTLSLADFSKYMEAIENRYEWIELY